MRQHCRWGVGGGGVQASRAGSIPLGRLCFEWAASAGEWQSKRASNNLVPGWGLGAVSLPLCWRLLRCSSWWVVCARIDSCLQRSLKKTQVFFHEGGRCDCVELSTSMHRAEQGGVKCNRAYIYLLRARYIVVKMMIHVDLCIHHSTLFPPVAS